VLFGPSDRTLENMANLDSSETLVIIGFFNCYAGAFAKCSFLNPVARWRRQRYTPSDGHHILH